MAAAETLYDDIDHCVDNPPPLVISEISTIEKKPEIVVIRNWTTDAQHRMDNNKASVPRVKIVNRNKPSGDNIMQSTKNTPKASSNLQHNIVPVISKATNNKPMNVEILRNGSWIDSKIHKPMLTVAPSLTVSQVLEQKQTPYVMEYEEIIRTVNGPPVTEQMSPEIRRDESIKLSRELKHLHQSAAESRVLSEYISEASDNRVRKVRKLKDHSNDTEESVSSNKSRRSSTISDHFDSPDSSLRIMRSNNPEFSQKRDDFISRFVNDTLSDNAEDDSEKLSNSSSMPSDSRIIHPPKVRTKYHLIN